MPTIDRLCVYCASSLGTDDAVVEATRAFGRVMVERGIDLVYGGGAVGLMGLIADTVLEGGGRVTGIIPSGLFPREVGHTSCTELIEVGTMHERKTLMFERSDAFVALPGGLGTLEELAEVTTWSQIGIHSKPIGVLDVGGYWSGLFEFLDRGVATGLLKPENAELILRHDDPASLLDALAAHEPVSVPKWLDLDET